MVNLHSAFYFVFIFLFIFKMSESVAGHSFAFVDRTQIGKSETVTLTIEVSNQIDSPNVSVLSKDFKILNKSKSSTVNIADGRMESKNQWVFTLMPKSVGMLVIPGISVGADKTKPIKISVQKQKVARTIDNPDLFLEVFADPQNSYVQSQIRYTIRLYQSINLFRGSFSEPKFSNAIVEKLGEGTTFETVKNNRRYRVNERQYAIFPQSSGPLIFPPVIFDGEIAHQNSHSPNSNLYGLDPFNRMFSQGKLIRVFSKRLQINVRPQANNYKGSWWLPAKNVELQETWTSNKGKYRVGEPITRTITLRGIGITSAQLPDLPVDELEYGSLYPDKATNESQLINGNLVATKQQKIVIIPSQSGRFPLPKIEIHWWDIVQDKARVAVIKEKFVNVLPAVSQTQHTQNEVKIAESGNPFTIKLNGVSVSEPKLIMDTNQSQLLKIVTWLLLIAWIITMYMWRQQRKKFVKTRINEFAQTHVSDKQAQLELRAACMQNNAPKTRELVLSLAKTIWPQAAIRNLKDLANQINDEKAKSALSMLDLTVYGSQSTPWKGDLFYQQLIPFLNRITKTN